MADDAQGPTPGCHFDGRVVRPGFTRRLAKFVGVSIVPGLVVSFILIVATPPLVAQIARPTCENRGNLQPVSAKSAKASDESKPPAGSPDEKWTAPQSIDGEINTEWAFPISSISRKPTIEYTFANSVNLQLICIVNGEMTSDASYSLAGSLREVSSKSRNVTRTSFLRHLPSDTRYDRQELIFAKGLTKTIDFSVISVYPGEKGFDPGRSSAEERAKLRAPSGNAAAAEIEFYQCVKYRSFKSLFISRCKQAE